MQKRLVSLVVLLTLLVVPAAFATERSKAMERPLAPFDRAAHFEQMFSLNAALHATALPLAATVPLEIDIADEERATVRGPQVVREQKMRVGVVRDLWIPMTIEAQRRMTPRLHDTFGAVAAADDGALAAGIVDDALAAGFDGDAVGGFGATDCDCGSHLVHGTDREALYEAAWAAHKAAERRGPVDEDRTTGD